MKYIDYIDPKNILITISKKLSDELKRVKRVLLSKY